MRSATAPSTPARARRTRLPADLQAAGAGWRAPAPPLRNTRSRPARARRRRGWRSPAQTAHALALMSPLHRARVPALASDAAATSAPCSAGWPRGRPRVQRAEVRFDGLAGACAPRGGLAPGPGGGRPGEVRTRLVTARRRAPDGLADDYACPPRSRRAARGRRRGAFRGAMARRHLLEHLIGAIRSASRRNKRNTAVGGRASRAPAEWDNPTWPISMPDRAGRLRRRRYRRSGRARSTTPSSHRRRHPLVRLRG